MRLPYFNFIENNLWKYMYLAPDLLKMVWQQYALKNLIGSALKTAAYKELWKNLHIDPEKFYLGDLERLPVVSKVFYRTKRAINYLVLDRRHQGEWVRFICDSVGETLRYSVDIRLYWRRAFLCERAKEKIYFLWELGPVAEKCPDTEGYHPYEESLILEVVSLDGKKLDDGFEGRVVITYFDNHYMPFVRYDTNERGFYLDTLCHCGKKLFIPKERPERLIVFKNRIFKARDFDRVFCFYFAFIDRYEIIKFSNRKLYIKLIPGRFWEDSLMPDLKKHLNEMVGEGIEINFEIEHSHVL